MVAHVGTWTEEYHAAKGECKAKSRSVRQGCREFSESWIPSRTSSRSWLPELPGPPAQQPCQPTAQTGKNDAQLCKKVFKKVASHCVSYFKKIYHRTAWQKPDVPLLYGHTAHKVDGSGGVTKYWRMNSSGSALQLLTLGVALQ